MVLILGIDLACRAAHQASLARPDGTFIWTGRRFFTRPAEARKTLHQASRGSKTLGCLLFERRGHGADRDRTDPQRPGTAGVMVSPPGARVSMVPTTQSADLRAYYSKHAKNDHLDSKNLARLPLLHPEGGRLRPRRRREKRRRTRRHVRGPHLGVGGAGRNAAVARRCATRSMPRRARLRFCEPATRPVAGQPFPPRR